MFRVPEVIQMDGLGFSLCAMLDIVGSCISEWCEVGTMGGRKTGGGNGGLVYSQLGWVEVSRVMINKIILNIHIQLPYPKITHKLIQ